MSPFKRFFGSSERNIEGIAGSLSPPHKRLFTVEVSLNNEKLGTGEGYQKKKAEQLAAQQAIQLLGIN